MKDIYLGVNIDHVATIRNARGVDYPDPVFAASIAEQAGADGITTHLREDRRHIKDRDVRILRETIKTRMNLEMAVTEEMVNIAVGLAPQFVCMVPEKRQEVTTEGGLDVKAHFDDVKDAVARLSAVGTKCSLFIDADKEQIDAAVKTKAPYIELHTGRYADANTLEEQEVEFNRLKEMAKYASSLGLKVNGGHGLNYQNAGRIAQIPEIEELNIGHSIIARAVFTGLAEAVAEMKKVIVEARKQSYIK
ncbi:MAG: pyridoxine 5'-phosphate synthase [Succinivibrionaceae bacterium]|nr:pyridoxine 5'-phosphate synthase [Ruminobacter sp.]MDY5778896.1 pyridoxine 5'-phosphate synthase [Succinivibrionaceae bacterium]MEE1340820.1 pyridoxine 5'-phosphate synthase [Succinivibrionaceae bacterium]